MLELKAARFFPKLPKINLSSFYLKSYVFQSSLTKLQNIWATFVSSKSAQSGHTVPDKLNLP